MYQKRIIAFGVSILLLAALIYSVDYNELFRITSKISTSWIVFLVILQLTILFLMSVKWYVLIRRYAVSFSNVLYTSFIGFMVNSVTPVTQAGGEPVRAYVISRIDKIKMEKALATVLVDLFINMIPVLFMTLLAILLVFKYSADLRIAWLLALIGLFILSLMIASFTTLTSREPSMNLLRSIIKVIVKVKFLSKYALKAQERLEELFLSFQTSINRTMADIETLGVATLISFIIWFLTIFRVYMVFAALGVPVDFEVVVIVYSVLLMVSMIPLLPGSLGLWEWIGAGLFTFFGIPLEASVAITLIDRLLFYWLPLFTGFLSSIHVGLNVAKLVDGRA